MNSKEPIFDNAFAIDEVTVKDGRATVVYEMPEVILEADSQEEVSTDGEYVLYVKNGKLVMEKE